MSITNNTAHPHQSEASSAIFATIKYHRRKFLPTAINLHNDFYNNDH